jgi:hypothetical protein
MNDKAIIHSPIHTGGPRFPYIYALLKAAGHDSAKATEILRDALCNDTHARSWIKVIAASRWSVLSASSPHVRKYARWLH